MSETIASPSPFAVARRTWLRLWNDPDTRSVIVGVIGMLLVHLLLLGTAPYLLRSDRVGSVIRPHSSSRQFNIEIAPEVFAPPRPKPPPNRFVETNPNAPENVPDKTNNFAAQNQQVAQEKPTPNGKSDRPAMEGQKEIHSTQIVSGMLDRPQPQTPVPPAPQTPKETARTAPRRQENPLSGFEKKIGEDADAFGTGKAAHVEGAKAIPEKIEGMQNAPVVEGATSAAPAIDPKHPRPRPMIVKSIQARPAIFEENKFGTQNVGVIGVSAEFSNYGAYLQRLVETVDREWRKIIADSTTYPTPGTHAIVKFQLNDKGVVSAIVNVESTAGDQGTQSCVSAITNRSPYGEWTDDMKAVLGKSQELTFSFYYQ
ncbi:MAG TPA: hypothetical protein VG710_12845 [Opitutus sp.]|nr:hypothetical protein [Opitutus sp.]